MLKSLFISFLLFLSCNYLFAQFYEAGNSFSDTTGFIEYIAGNTPVIISVPHGGYLEPDSIPDCPGCSTVRDAFTQEIGRGLSNVYFEQTGCYPHVIINLLHRRKLDANRDIEEATGGIPLLITAWNAYHEFIEIAKMRVEKDYQKGLFVDLHGHGHDIQRIELGFLLSKSNLQLSDSELNVSTILNKSSILNLVNSNLQDLSHSELIRGTQSLGSILNIKGFPSVPSDSDLYPENDEPYFTGGYNTQRHGSRDGGTIDGIQLEFNQDIRFDEALRDKLIDSLATSLSEYIDLHYIVDFSQSQCGAPSNLYELNSVKVLQLIPNPTFGEIELIGLQENAQLIIYDLLGQERGQLEWNGEKLDLGFLGNGHYYLVLRRDDEIRAGRLMVLK